MLAFAAVSAGTLGLAGCHPRPLSFIVWNQGAAVHSVTLTCPAGSASVDQIPANGQFTPDLLMHDAGNCSIHFLDPAGKQHGGTTGSFQKYSTGVIRLYIDEQFQVRTNMNQVNNHPIQPGEPNGSFGKRAQPAPLWKTKKK
jgi:hypothetical protein